MGHWPIESSNLSLSATAERLRGMVRFFRLETASGLAVSDIPADVTRQLGGLKQMCVKGRLNGVGLQLEHHAGGRRRPNHKREQEAARRRRP